MERKKIESIIEKRFTRSAPVILSVILALWVLNANNVYRLFANEDTRLRSKLQATEEELRISSRINNNVKSNAQLIGNKLPFLEKYVKEKGYTLIALTNHHTEAKSLQIIRRIVNTVVRNNMAVKKYFFSDSVSGNTTETIVIDSGHFDALPLPKIILLGAQNAILMSFTVDPFTTTEEANYLKDVFLLSTKSPDFKDVSHNH